MPAWSDSFYDGFLPFWNPLCLLCSGSKATYPAFASVSRASNDDRNSFVFYMVLHINLHRSPPSYFLVAKKFIQHELTLPTLFALRNPLAVRAAAIIFAVFPINQPRRPQGSVGAHRVGPRGHVAWFFHLFMAFCEWFFHLCRMVFPFIYEGPR